MREAMFVSILELLSVGKCFVTRENNYAPTFAPWGIKPNNSSASFSHMGVHEGVGEHLFVAGVVHGSLVVGEFLGEVILTGTYCGEPFGYTFWDAL